MPFRAFGNVTLPVDWYDNFSLHSPGVSLHNSKTTTGNKRWIVNKSKEILFTTGTRVVATTNSNDYALVDCGTRNGRIRVFPGSTGAGVFLRWIGVNHWLSISNTTTESNTTRYHFHSEKGNLTGPATASSLAQYYDVRMEDSLIRIYHNGSSSSILSLTGDNHTGHYHGIIASSGNPTWESFYYWVATGTPPIDGGT